MAQGCDSRGAPRASPCARRFPSRGGPALIYCGPMYLADQIQDRCPVTGMRVTRSQDWTDIQLASDYRVTFAILGECILLTHARGHAGEDGVPRLFQERARVMRDAGLYNRHHLEIRDYSGIVRGHPSKGRVQFTLGLIAEGQRGYLKGFWGFNGTFALRAIMSVAKRLIGYDGIPVGFVTDYETAVLSALAAQQHPTFAEPAPPLHVDLDNLELPFFGEVVQQRNLAPDRLQPREAAADRPVWSDLELRRRVDALLQFLGGINWSIEGVQPHRAAADDPLAVLYDAVSVLKNDFDTVLQEKAEIQQQLLQSARLASIGTLAAGFAHELNNPLTAVLGYAQQLRASAPDAQSRKAATVILRASRRMKGLVDQLCQLNREPSLTRWYTLSVPRLVADALQLCAPRQEELQVQVHSSCAPGLPHVRGDGDHLVGVLQGLLVNAFDAFAARPGGRQRRSDLPARAVDRVVLLSVRDNAGGMPPGAQAQAFDPFFTGKDVGKGVGLGLYIAHEIVKAHGGSMALQSTPGEGTCVTLRLPAQPR